MDTDSNDASTKTFAKKAAAGLALVLAAMLPLLALFFTAYSPDDLAQSELPTAVVSDAPPPFVLADVSDDVLWLARCMYSETKKPHEQELVGWVIRNRVETEYRGASTYEGVVTDPYQFSAFNPGSPKRRLYTTLTPETATEAFQRTLAIAHDVYYARSADRPFPTSTRHFYSERSMVGGAAPNWSAGHQPIRPTGFRVDPRRFRFYSGVASALSAAPLRLAL
ncbi:cell wall hydrolase [Rubrivirga sp. S365]|uniref:Cell wall hydrolase n=1 Tax=Rubrivirga litoralis TaxID=3075598 RepID=A0ABU3BPC7_9BACT|nr:MULTISPECIES: cell wall hydrolase [unclassified Rubrivirga]MDT0631142.1 cell wall hydrolase [Rubrivirga sp. F394]MDT7855345.1 cell wall hydrolase [Rubrivirga sp. S365]